MPRKGFRTSMHSTAKLMYVYHQGGQEAVGQTQPHIPLLHSRPFCFLSKPMAFAPLLCSLAGSPRALPHRLEMHPTTQQGDDRWSSGEGVGTSEGPQFFSPPQPSSHLSAAQEGERPRLPNPKPWCSQHPRRAGTEQVAFSLSDRAQHWQLGSMQALLLPPPG